MGVIIDIVNGKFLIVKLSPLLRRKCEILHDFTNPWGVFKWKALSLAN